VRPVVFVVPGRIETRTGGYIYDRRIVEGLRDRGRRVDVCELDAAFPFPPQASLDRAAKALSGVRDGAIVVVDGLALGAMPDQIEREASRLRIVALVHLPLAAEMGIDRETAGRREGAERRALHAAALVVVTGRATLSMIAPYELSRDRVVVVEPGTDRAPLATGSGGMPLQLLSVATIGPGKGHEILARALAEVPHRHWRLTCVGSVTRHPATVDRVRSTIRGHGLEHLIALAGELDGQALDDCYRRADLFVLATLQETYCMAVAEALAHGLPVVSTTTGAIPDLVGDGAGLLVPPGDVTALTVAIARALDDAPLRMRLVEGARCARDRLPSWELACEKMNAALARLDADG